MGEHRLHPLIPVTDSAAGNVESTRARESHSAVRGTHLGSIHFPNWEAGRTSIANASRHRNSVREIPESAASLESFVISGADDVAVTFADERLS